MTQNQIKSIADKNKREAVIKWANTADIEDLDKIISNISKVLHENTEKILSRAIKEKTEDLYSFKKQEDKRMIQINDIIYSLNEEEGLVHYIVEEIKINKEKVACKIISSCKKYYFWIVQKNQSGELLYIFSEENEYLTNTSWKYFHRSAEFFEDEKTLFEIAGKTFINTLKKQIKKSEMSIDKLLLDIEKEKILISERKQLIEKILKI